MLLRIRTIETYLDLGRLVFSIVAALQVAFERAAPLYRTVLDEIVYILTLVTSKKPINLAIVMLRKRLHAIAQCNFVKTINYLVPIALCARGIPAETSGIVLVSERHEILQTPWHALAISNYFDDLLSSVPT